MTDQPPYSRLRAFFRSVYGKLIAVLVVVLLVLGVAIEIVTFQKLTYDRDISGADARAKNRTAPSAPRVDEPGQPLCDTGTPDEQEACLDKQIAQLRKH